MGASDGSGRFSALLLEGLDHYRKGRMLEAVRAWEEAYLLEPTNLRAREFLRSALERIHAHMAPAAKAATAAPAAPAPHPWLPQQPPENLSAGKTQVFAAPPLGAQPQGQTRTFAKPSAPPDASKNPWDEGPSLAIPQPEDPGGGRRRDRGVDARRARAGRAQRLLRGAGAVGKDPRQEA